MRLETTFSSLSVHANHLQIKSTIIPYISVLSKGDMENSVNITDRINITVQVTYPKSC